MQEARNVYTEYLVDKAGAGTVEQNVYIEVESGKFVEVLAGKVVAQSNGKYIMATAPTESEKGNQVEKTPAAEGVAAVPYTNIWSGKAN